MCAIVAHMDNIMSIDFNVLYEDFNRMNGVDLGYVKDVVELLQTKGTKGFTESVANQVKRRINFSELNNMYNIYSDIQKLNQSIDFYNIDNVIQNIDKSNQLDKDFI